MSSQWLPSSVLAYDVAADQSVGTTTEEQRLGFAEAFIALQLLWGLALFIPGAQATSGRITWRSS